MSLGLLFAINAALANAMLGCAICSCINDSDSSAGEWRPAIFDRMAILEVMLWPVSACLWLIHLWRSR